jgi:hypothetical protein
VRGIRLTGQRANRAFARAAGALGRLPPKDTASTRLRVVIASLIATTSLVAAIGAWRASVASSAGGDADRKGFDDSVARARAEAGIRANLAAIVLDYGRARSYEAQAKAIHRQAHDAAPQDRTRLVAMAEAAERLEKVARDSIDPDALRTNGKLNLGRKFQLDLRLQESTQDLDAKPEFQKSDKLSQKSERLVGLTALLVGAALFFTLAQVSRRRVYLVYLVTGIVVLVVSTSLLITVELTT